MAEQDTGRRVKCDVCGRTYYGSVAGPCYRKPEKNVCMYCCVSKCKNGYRSGGAIGCRAFDKEREKTT